ncbi:hypothetical protein FQN54_006325 [Arachnomyces sp. PD_36]|nr:hypothetical protein FQN54_006325 [Arachnomyces sp. PD_36]
MSGEKIYEGVFAVNKPQGISSAQVIRELQKHFNPSKTFRPWIEDEREKRLQDPNVRRRRKSKRVDVKIGHGGTLDPLATGVLIAGLGKGTKELPGFLGCTKTYEAILLFGAETDTYDRVGKVVKKAPYEHITREAVEKALANFRGNIMQKPPIFSALRVQGKRLYDYAREGIEPPVEIVKRPVEVSNLEIVEWYEGGEHPYTWPEEELAGEEKAVAERMLAKDVTPEPEPEPKQASEQEETKATEQPTEQPPEESTSKEQSTTTTSKRKPSQSPPAAEPSTSTTDPSAAPPSPKRQKTSPGPTQPTAPPPSTSLPPAVKLTMTVSSGFYVRSLCHDLGKAVGSCGLMSELVRSRQADFELGEGKVLEFEDLEKGEEVWGPKVTRFLDEWVKRKGEGEGE